MGGRIGPPIRDEFDRMLRAFILSEIERERERDKKEKLQQGKWLKKQLEKKKKNEIPRRIG